MSHRLFTAWIICIALNATMVLFAAEEPKATAVEEEQRLTILTVAGSG